MRMRSSGASQTVRRMGIEKEKCLCVWRGREKAPKLQSAVRRLMVALTFSSTSEINFHFLIPHTACLSAARGSV